MSTLVNVCGASRSGSTMLDVMLGNGARAFSCGEVYAWFRPWRTHHRRIACACGADPCPFWEKIAYLREEVFHRGVCDRLDVDFVIDSSKHLLWLIDSQAWAKKSRMSVFNILIYKPPIELAFSQFKRGRDPMSWREDFVRYHNRLLKLGLPFRAVSYRELTRTPGETLAKICSLVGMNYSNGQERAAKVQSHHTFGSFGLRRQLEEGGLSMSAEPCFSSDFEKVKASLEGQIARDGEVSEILHQLERRHIDSATSAQRDGAEDFRRPIVMPVWYYSSKAKGAIRRLFPQEFNAPDRPAKREQQS